MSSGRPNYFLLVIIITSVVAMFLNAKRVRARNPRNEYFNLKGKKLKFKTANIDGKNYAFCIEYLISEEYLGIRCYVPPFTIVTKYSDIKLLKSKALIGSVIQVIVPSYDGKIEISHALAQKIEELSDGKFGYKNI
jgi:hypothetical protein